MNKKHSEREFLKGLAELNIRRAFKSSVMLAIVLPIIIAVSYLVPWGNVVIKSTFMTAAAFLELVQIGYAIVFHMDYSRDEFDNYHNLYLSYYALSAFLLLVCAGCDMRGFGSEIFYFAVCVYMVLVPVLADSERVIFIAAQTVIMLSMVLGFRLDIRFLIDVCIAQVATLLVSKYQQANAFAMLRMNARLKKKNDISEHDALTGLFNRRGLEMKVAMIWPFCERRKIPVGVIAIDIDFFKKYNDSFGHPKGDECLREVAKVIRNSAKRNTDVVTRTGGEEFLVFVQDIDSEDLVSLCMKIRNNLEERAIPQAYFEVSRNVTVSIGAASFVPSYGKTFDMLYEEADKALYTAKKSGRNCIVYNGNLYGKIRHGMARVVSI